MCRAEATAKDAKGGEISRPRRGSSARIGENRGQRGFVGGESQRIARLDSFTNGDAAPRVTQSLVDAPARVSDSSEIVVKRGDRIGLIRSVRGGLDEF